MAKTEAWYCPDAMRHFAADEACFACDPPHREFGPVTPRAERQFIPGDVPPGGPPSGGA